MGIFKYKVNFKNGDSIQVNMYFKPREDEVDWIKKLLTDLYEKKHVSIDDFFGKFPSKFDNDFWKILINAKATSYQDQILNLITPIWQFYLSKGDISNSYRFWERIYKSIIFFEKTNFRIHKGSLFYYWAFTAYKVQHLDRMILLVHQAVKEDQKTHKTKYPKTPAFKTATLDYMDDQQFMYQFVVDLRNYLEVIINEYNDRNNRCLTPEEFHKRFLEKPHDIDTIYNFTHTLAKLNYYNDFPVFITENDYYGLFLSKVIFNIILVIDSAILNKTPDPENDWSFKRLMKFLLVHSKVNTDESQNQANLTTINDCENVAETLSDLLKGNFVFNSGHIANDLERSIFIAYKLRNFEAHNIKSLSIVQKDREEILQRIFDVLFLTTETFY